MVRTIKCNIKKAVKLIKGHKVKVAGGLLAAGTQASALTADLAGIETDVTTTATAIIAVVVIIFAAGVVMSLLRRG